MAAVILDLLIKRSAGWYEGACQTLTNPMVVGTNYSFSIDIATTNSTGGGILPGCIELQVWGNMGGNSGCDETINAQLLWSSGNVYPALVNMWQTFTVSFTPTQPWTTLLFMSHNLGCTNQPYIMMDNLSPISPIADNPQFTWTNVCIGSNMQFTDASTSSQGIIIAWDWDFGDGSPHSTIQSPSHLYTTPGTYNVTLTVTSTVPCVTTVTHAVTVNPLPTVAVAPANPGICQGSSIACTASGANTYAWSPPTGLSATTGTTVTANPAATTTYSVTGTDVNGCTNTTSFTVTVSPIVTPTITVVNASCGLSNGSATASPAGLSYLWSNAQATQTIGNLAAGNYTVTVTSNGCTGSAACVVIGSNAGNVSVTETDEHCGHSDGTATATIIGGTPPYNYTWSNAQNTATITAIPAGNYTVTATDGNGCTATGTVTVSNLAGPSLQIVSITNAKCTQPNGSATVNGINGTPPYTYLWSNGDNIATASNLSPGIYGATVTDANNCIAMNSLTVTDSPPPTLQTSTTPSNCGLPNGTATVTVMGGLSPYTYLWNTTVPQTTPTATNVAAGGYMVTVTDANGCTAIAVATIFDLPGPHADFSYHPHVVNILNGFVSFSDNSTGSVTSWVWTFGDGYSAVGQQYPYHQYTDTGTYVVTEIVTDVFGCTDTAKGVVIVQDIYTIYIPSAFSPNNNNINDTWKPEGINYDPNSYELDIFDRWGKRLFKTTDFNEGWNGTFKNKGTWNKAMEGVYVYVIAIKEMNDGPRHLYKGSITIIQ